MYSANNLYSQPINQQNVFYARQVGGNMVPALQNPNNNMYSTPLPLVSSPYQIQYTVPVNQLPFQQPHSNIVPPQNIFSGQPVVFQSTVPQYPLEQSSPFPNEMAFHSPSVSFSEPKYEELAKFDDPFELKEISYPPVVNISPPVVSVSPIVSNIPNKQLDASFLPKRCKRCSKYYTLAELSECRYHSGQYKCWYSSKVMAGRISSWTCCKNDERGIRGCKVSSSHIECEATSATLSQLDNLLSIQRPTVPTTKPSKKFVEDEKEDEFIDKTVDLSINMESFKLPPDPVPSPEVQKASLDPDAQLVYENGKQYIKHIVKYTDTLQGLSLKYNVTGEDIRSTNKITREEEIWSRHIILIPFNGQVLRELNEDEKEQYRNDMRKRLVRRFLKTTKCSCDAEALYYLQINSFNFDVAVAEYVADSKWELQNKHTHFTSVKA